MGRAKKVVILCFIWLSLATIVHAESGYRYKGKTPSEWLADVVNYTNRSVALSAFRQMGTNGHPALLGALVQCDSKLYNLYPQLPGFVRGRLSAPMKVRDIEFAVLLVLLNSDSRPLMSKALKLLEEASPDVRYTIIVGLENKVRDTDAELAPSFGNALTDTNSNTRVAALICLRSIGRGASSQVPAVINCLHDTDPMVRVTAAFALWSISGETNQAVPVLRSALEQNYPVRHWAAAYLLDTDSHLSNPLPDLMPIFIGSLQQPGQGVRISACYCLLRYGTEAKAAVPQLLKLLHDPNGAVREGARKCLEKVSPESLGK